MTQTIEQFSQSKTTLAQYVDAHGRNAAAKTFGCTPAAISKAINAGRNIFVEQEDSRLARAVEVSCFPCRSLAAKSTGKAAGDLAGYF